MRTYPSKVASQKRWYKSKIIECDCGFGETFLKIDYSDYNDKPIVDDIQPSWYVTICQNTNTFKERIKAAWNVLRDRSSYLYSISIDAQDIKELRDIANYWLDNLEPELKVHLLKEGVDETNS